MIFLITSTLYCTGLNQADGLGGIIVVWIRLIYTRMTKLVGQNLAETFDLILDSWQKVIEKCIHCGTSTSLYLPEKTAVRRLFSSYIHLLQM